MERRRLRYGRRTDGRMSLTTRAGAESWLLVPADTCPVCLGLARMVTATLRTAPRDVRLATPGHAVHHLGARCNPAGPDSEAD
jgi:hypothetical protein